MKEIADLHLGILPAREGIPGPRTGRSERENRHFQRILCWPLVSAIRAKPFTAGNDLPDLFMALIQNDVLDVFYNR